MPKPEQTFAIDDRQTQDAASAAKATFQLWVDAMGDTFLRNDFEAYAAIVTYPLVVKTDAAVMTVPDIHKLREGFDAWAGMTKTHKIDAYHHNVLDAAWLSESKVTAIFETTFTASGTQVMPTFTTLVEIVRKNENWCAVTIVNGMKNITWPIRSPIFVPDENGIA